MRNISPIEYNEYQVITNMVADKCKEYKALFNVLTNVPYKEVLTKNNLNEDLYTLKYSLYNTYNVYTLNSMYYSFNKEKLEQMKKVMELITDKIKNELKIYFSQFDFKYHSKEDIEKIIDRIGYWNIEIENANTDKRFLYKAPSKKYRKNRHDFKREKNNADKREIFEDYYDDFLAYFE